MAAMTVIVLKFAVPALLILGVALTLRGWRGRRIGPGPCCRRCGHDLNAVAANHCPHCGMLLLPDAITENGRLPHRTSLLAGLALVALSMAGAAYWLTNGAV